MYKRQQQRKHRDKVEELKRLGLTDPAMREWTFANDNGRNPQMKTARFYVEHWAVSYTHLDVYKRQQE